MFLRILTSEFRHAQKVSSRCVFYLLVGAILFFQFPPHVKSIEPHRNSAPRTQIHCTSVTEFEKSVCDGYKRRVLWYNSSFIECNWPFSIFVANAHETFFVRIVWNIEMKFGENKTSEKTAKRTNSIRLHQWDLLCILNSPSIGLFYFLFDWQRQCGCHSV